MHTADLHVKTLARYFRESRLPSTLSKPNYASPTIGEGEHLMSGAHSSDEWRYTHAADGHDRIHHGDFEDLIHWGESRSNGFPEL
jgi:hypothetical protein